MKTQLCILPRLRKIPKIYNTWTTILSRYHEGISDCVIAEDYDSVEDRLEAEVVRTVVRSVLEFGNYEGSINGFYSDCGDESVDMSLAEDIVNNVFSGSIIREYSEEHGEQYIDVDLYGLVQDLRLLLCRHLDNHRFINHEGSLNIRIIETVHPLVPEGVGGDWLINVESRIHDTGLIVVPTIDEFKTLLYYWQEKFGEYVGHANSEKAVDEVATYIGRQNSKYGGSGLEMPQVSMGNPYSHLSDKPFRYVDSQGLNQILLLETKLDACFAYYVKTINDLIQRGNENDVGSNHRHWVRFYNLYERPLACHCSNFSNGKSASRFCHGLVIAGISEAMWA